MSFSRRINLHGVTEVLSVVTNLSEKHTGGIFGVDFCLQIEAVLPAIRSHSNITQKTTTYQKFCFLVLRTGAVL
jgi:hypothetical protein